MNRDKVVIHETEPTGKVMVEKDGPLGLPRMEVGRLEDPETGETMYRLSCRVGDGLPIIVHAPSGRRWMPSWRTLVSLAEREGIRGEEPDPEVEGELPPP